jgi:hypothetical protein
MVRNDAVRGPSSLEQIENDRFISCFAFFLPCDMHPDFAHHFESAVHYNTILQ